MKKRRVNILANIKAKYLIMLKILIFSFLILSCSSQKISFDSGQNITNLIVCEYLREIEGVKSNDQSVYIYKGFQKEKNDHTFCRKYIDNSVKDDTTEFINWVDKNLSSLCEISQNIFISEQDFHYQHFNKKHAVFRISDIYFLSKTTGCFIASRVCGENCEEAKIYTFECNDGKSCGIKLAAYYFIN
ncbi:MAG: hypothetical protein IPI53_16165 [Saprospiraceae bacterium]|nr:hypothetical protein [Saprospiraceae bacterium]